MVMGGGSVHLTTLFPGQVSLWNFEIIRGSLMRPEWPKLASLARKHAHSSFSSPVHSLLSKDNFLRTYLTSLQLVTGTVWRR